MAEENGRLLPEDASLAAEAETLTDAPPLMTNAVCSNTFADYQKQSELDRPSTSGGIDSSITATDFSPQSSLPSASSKIVNIRVKQTDSGLPESSAITPKERISEDLSLFQGLLNNILEPTEAIEVIKAFRLGKRADNPSMSTRPPGLKVVLASSDQASLIYSRRFRIKGSNPVYRPPRRDNMADARLLEELEKFATRPDILIMGDFNAPHINWSSTHANGSEQTFDRSFLNTALKLFLTQHVMLPTRVREGQQANCLDLVLTKSQDSIDEVS
nr:unnamed protein product [Spirometra erinaceieuropaei]